MDHLKKWNHLYSILVGMALMGIIWFGMSNANSKQLKISIGDASLEMQAENMEIRHEELLDMVYADNFARGGLIEWLANKQIFEVANPDIVDVIATKVCAPIPEDDWEMKLHFGRDCAEKPIVAELRRRADHRRVPFHYIGDIVTVGVPENPRPSQGRAYACRDGIFWGKNVRLTNLNDNQRVVNVEVIGYYACTDPTAPKIQLGEEDAIVLFEGPTRKIERAEAIVMN